MFLLNTIGFIMLTSLFLLNGLSLAQQPDDETTTEQETESEESQTEKSQTEESSTEATEHNGATKKEPSTDTKPPNERPKEEILLPVDVATLPARIILINGNHLDGQIPEELTDKDQINIEIDEGVIIPVPSPAIQDVDYTSHKFKQKDHAHLYAAPHIDIMTHNFI